MNRHKWIEVLEFLPTVPLSRPLHQGALLKSEYTQMGNSVSLRVWSEHDDDVIVNSPFLRRNRRIPTITRTSEDGSSSSSSGHFSSNSSEDTIALSAGSSSSLDTSIELEEANAPSIINQSTTTRQCWICYGEEEVPEEESISFNSRWVSPCACKGTTKWVHQSCLLDWIDSQLRAGSGSMPLRSGALVIEDAQLACPQCHVPYRLHQAYALPRPLLHLLDVIAGVKERVLIYSTVGLASSAIYTLSFSHGFWSGWMLGGTDFINWIHTAYSPNHGTGLARLQVTAGVPMIPLFALSLQFPGMVGWLYPLAPLFIYAPGMQIASVRGFMMAAPLLLLTGRTIVRILKRVIGRGGEDEGEVEEGEGNSIELDTSTLTSPTTSPAPTSPTTLSPTLTATSASPRTLRISILSTTGALLFPGTCSLLGRLLCKFSALSQLSVFQKSLVGAGVMVCVRAAVEMVYWYQQVHLKRYRRVLDST